MFPNTIIIIIIIVLLIFNGFLDGSFIYSHVSNIFFDKFSISHGIILTCYNERERIRLLKHVISNNKFILANSNINKFDHLDLFHFKHGRIGVMLDGNCKKSERFITMCGQHRLFDIKYYWLIFSRGDIEFLFSWANFNLDSNIYAIPTNGTFSKQLDIYEFYNPASLKGGNSVLTKIGEFNNRTGYMVNNNHGKFWQRRNLTEIVFNATIVLHEPYSGSLEEYLQNNDNREENTYNRFHARLIKFCKEYYNFSLNINNVTTLFGYQKGDGTMDGLVGDLERDISDFGLSPLFVRRDRAEVITFGRQTYTIRSAFVFLNPKSKEVFGLFLRPLSPSVWYCLLGFFIWASLFIRATSYSQLVNNSDSSWAHSILCVIGILSQQGTILTPTVLSGRLGILFVLNLTYFVYLFYSGSLVSSLLNIPLDLIETVGDLLNANFNFGIEDIRFNREYFKYTVDNTSIKLYVSAVMGKENHAYLNATKGLKLMKAGHYAFHVELAKAYPFLKRHFKRRLCEIREVPLYKPPQCYANYVKHSPFRDIMDICLHRLAESGIMQKEYLFWQTEKPKCSYSYEINTGLNEVYPILIAMFIGFTISTIFLFYEITSFQMQNRQS